MKLIKKTKKDEEIRYNLENELSRLNAISLLMEIKPYRRSILNQIYNSKHIYHKKWNKLSFEEKQIWIKENMFEKWTKDEFIDHIINAIKLLCINENYKFSFEIALGMEL